MADKNDGGDKTENATPKKLQDAKKKGDVAKSRDITNTLVLSFALLALWQFSSFITKDFEIFMSKTLSLEQESFQHQLHAIGKESIRLFLTVSAVVFIPVIIFSLFADFLQIGPIFTFEKIKPKMSHLNPIDGLKRMFSMDSLFELLKSVFKTLSIFCLATLIAIQAAPQLLSLSSQSPQALSVELKSILIDITLWTCVIFAFISTLDTIWQKHSFAKKMKMSTRDIKQEYKDTEGDPHMKSHRKQTAQEWAQEGAASAASNASVLVVNPTHVAIAINYDKKDNPVPVVTARGEMEIAATMRKAAEEAKVPVLRNELLARTLLANTEDGDFIPQELFDIVAEVILWADQVHNVLNRTQTTIDKQTPGQDLTRYVV